MHRLACVLPFLLAAPTLSAQAVAAPCYDGNLGSNLGLGDNAVAAGLPLGFVFPGPAGPVATVDVTSNGLVWFAPAPDSGCPASLPSTALCSGTLAPFLAGAPRLAALWTDLDPTGGGGVWFRAVPATATEPARAVVTWNVHEKGRAVQFVVQCQLVADGSFTLWYGPTVNVATTLRRTLVGITQGSGATADALDLSALAPGVPVDTGTNPTLHDTFQGPLDLAGHAYEFVPNGLGGYLALNRDVCAAAATAAYGQGCPVPTTFYEAFAPGTLDLGGLTLHCQPNGAGGYLATSAPAAWFGGFTNNLGLDDDDWATVALPFAFPHPGGATTSLEVVSNGYVWLAATGAADYDPLVATFLAGAPRLAPLWLDLDPSSGGGVFADLDPASGDFVVTWHQVPVYGGTNLVSVQLALRGNGEFDLRYATAANPADDALVGFTLGRGAPNPGARDVSATPWDSGPGGQPLVLAPAAGSLPRLGTTFVQELRQLPPGTSLGAWLLGFAPTNLDLAPFGLAGCRGYVDFTTPGASAVTFVLLQTPIATQSFAVPADSSLAGLSLYSQVAAWTGTFTPLGWVVGNGLMLRIGS